MQEIDAVASMLPMARCDLAELLTEADIATLKHLSQQGMGENTLRRGPRTPAISKHVLAQVPRVVKDFLAAHHPVPVHW